MFRLAFHPVVDDSYLVVAVVAALLLGLLAIGPPKAKAVGRRRKLLFALRTAVIVWMILAMLRPTVIYSERRKQPATLMILSDKSRSMTVADEATGRTRFEAMTRALDNAAPALAALAKDFEVKPYLFDAEAAAVPVRDGRLDLSSIVPDGEQTAIGHALESVVRQEAGKRLMAVILLSDGAQRAYAPRDLLPQAAAAQLKNLACPLYTVRFGQARGLGQAKDVAVTELLADPRVFVKNELPVHAQVRIDGFVNRDIPVKLLAETAPGTMEVVAQETIRTPVDGQTKDVRFIYTPEKAGEVKLTVSVEPHPGELVTTNNELSTFVHVLKGGLRVFYVEEFPGRFEQKYLVRSLTAAADMHVDRVNLNLRAPDTRPKDLVERFKPGKYDVYILGDVDSSAFRKEELQQLADSVKQGAGLLLLGGFHAFGPGGYADTPLAEVSPIQMNRIERQQPDAPVSRDLHIGGPIAMRPTQLGATRYSMSLDRDPAQSAKIWSQLPPMEGANRISEENLKPGALLLATTAKDEPLLIEQSLGAGRVMAMAADSTWRWWTHGFEAAHKRFWRQVILWLAKKDESTESNVWIKLAQRRFTPSQRVEFTTGASGPNGEPAPKAVLKAEIVLPDGKTAPIPLVQNDQQTSGTLRDTLQPGDYTIRVSATLEGKELGTTRARFLVIKRDLELDNAMADATMLENLAAMTGGRAVVPEELPALLKKLVEDSQEFEVVAEARHNFWDTWPYFLLLVGLLVFEWYLRKRWGMV